MYSRDEVARVRALAAKGESKKSIARTTGLSRSTVRAWLEGKHPGWQGELGIGKRRPFCFRCDEEQVPEWHYAYLLGQYLGDGSIATAKSGVHRLVISSDAKYPGIIAETVAALKAVIPTSAVRVRKAHVGECYWVMSHSKHMACIFPQHGPGRKHERNITLQHWQQEIVAREPEALLRGLIHSDGCRVSNRVRACVNGTQKSYVYPRYFFSNVSADIQLIFTDALDALAIEWRQNRWNSISATRRSGVAKLDSFIGPKS